jgi:prepilin-type N-terminal cleavage/methylation domain-containing protein
MDFVRRLTEKPGIKVKTTERFIRKFASMKERRKQFGSPRQIRSYLAGFTLVEVLIVIALLVVLVSMVLVATSTTRVGTQQQLTAATIGLLDTALQEYYDYTNDFPEPNLLEPLNVFDPIYTRRNASLYAQLSLVPDSKKILGRLADSQILKVDDYVSFRDRWGTDHDQQVYLLVLDAWGIPLDYRYAAGVNTFPVVTSAGPDKNFLTVADNIENRK